MFYCPNCYEPLDNPSDQCPTCNKPAELSLPNEKNTIVHPHQVNNFASFTKSADSRSVSRKKYLLIGFFIALAIFLREGGFVNWYLFQYDAQSKIQNSLMGNQVVYSSEGDINLKQANQSIETTNNTQGENWGIGFKLPGASPMVVDLTKEVEANLNKQTAINVQLEEIELSGLYWLPLIKSGSSKYRAVVQFVGKDSLNYTSTLEGTTDYSFSGICSVRTFKEILGKEIAKQIVSSVDSVVRK